MKVWILRHGEAQYRARTDAERELTANGCQEVLASAAHLLGEPLRWIIASPYVRAQQTAERVRQALGFADAVVTVPWLTPDSDPRQALDNLDLYAPDNVLLVSHQPLVGSLISLAVHGHVQQPAGMHTASLAELEADFPLAGAMNLIGVRHPG
ncbi:phosphohistidine phosphatase SixA [Pseudomonas sp. GD03842]|uniref:phosphohistidine phosphatase SixA n=1 Tax=Pseudomonas sp. GD03842 TaxID=2975385 RepID=UPI00244CEBE0|nr:phosphohistidine phosphatase SixA [Pseudomonas sp. GD03842]MDH0748747.1 phosphohistidine phosphatase SixA [Pseudomonas sp. GD03842]